MRQKQRGPASAIAGRRRAGVQDQLASRLDTRKYIAPTAGQQADSWLVKGWVPARTVTMLDGDDDRDTRQLALQFAMAFAAGRGWLGVMAPPGPNRCIFLSSAADALSLKHASADVEREFQLDRESLKGLAFVSRESGPFILAERSRMTGQFGPAATFDSLEALISDFGPGLLVLDHRDDLFAGDHANQAHIDSFMALLEGLCTAYDLTILLVAGAKARALH